MPDTDRFLSWIELDANAFAHNVKTFRKLLDPETRLQVVVKANAYGHGLPQMVELCIPLPIDYLGVHSLDEARRVREHGWTDPIQILGPVHPLRSEEVAELDAEVTVFDLDSLARLDQVGTQADRPIRCHLKLETGTYRQGVLPADIPAHIEEFRNRTGIELAGLSTHFANIEDTTDHSYAETQLRTFLELTTPLVEEFEDAMRQAACTAAVLSMPGTRLDMVRVGIGAYGYWPSRETLVSHRERGDEQIELRPILTWKTKIGQLRLIPSGSFVGYGCTERVHRDTQMAVLPIGYSDGLDRGLSRLGRVLVRGQRAPILGRICMNLTMVDVTDVPEVAVTDEVVVIGAQGDESLWADALAEPIQSIAYEVLARLSQETPRIPV